MVYVISFVLVVLSACFSGLNLGLMSLDPYELKRKITLGDARAAKIYPIRVRGNLLLVTLLLGNVAVNAALSIFLGSIASGLIAGIVSTALITIFGEIIPQAAFSRYSLEVGSRLTWLVRIFIFFFLPISFPLAWILDKLMGSELPTLYTKTELIKILEEHRHALGSEVEEDEERIATGALTYGDKKIEEIMTPRAHVVAVERDAKLTRIQIKKLKETGHTRFPVYKDKLNNIIGMLYLKDLVGLKTSNKLVKHVYDKKVFFVNSQQNLDHALTAFIKTKRHLFVVVNEKEKVEGVVSMEDVLEEIVGREIVDEFDHFVDRYRVAHLSGTDTSVTDQPIIR